MPSVLANKTSAKIGTSLLAAFSLSACVSSDINYAAKSSTTTALAQPTYQAATPAVRPPADLSVPQQYPADVQPNSVQAAALPQPDPNSGVIEQRLEKSAVPQPNTFIAKKIHTASIAQNGVIRTDDSQMETALVDPNDPETLAQGRIDQLYPTIKHATCKGGWATPPDRLDAKRTVSGQPYYMEMRLRHTPLLPVGHTYIAYGHLSPDGKPVDEHVVMLSPVGGYGGAAVAAAVPMPGVMTPVYDDCKLKPIAAYRVSLSAQEYEKLLRKIKQAHKIKPSYALFAYNCNHFASDIAGSVGIRPPKNKYAPALQYIYGVIEANEGYDPRKRRRS